MKTLIEKIKAILFYPFIALLIKAGITANMVSYFSAIVGLISVAFLWYDLKISAVLLIISLMIDGVDGSVARATKKNSLKGSVTDCFCDQATISASTIGFIAIGILDPIIGGFYLVLYPILITFSILRNIVNSPACYVLRPRIIVYGTFVLYAFGSINVLNHVVAILSAALLFQVVKDFYFLRSKLNG
ncbi:MAG: hypothetical protein UW03_C0028G0015 [Candidatus Peregrinibacteria bacterium GW2011_GWA2_43_8]|nr:MAG: hypothetical protein UW03_C0028G0015 [Candidatus Peregrinibacteria bacterium GW2011_GWA2_43_8]